VNRWSSASKNNKKSLHNNHAVLVSLKKHSLHERIWLRRRMSWYKELHGIFFMAHHFETKKIHLHTSFSNIQLIP
jgi:hypothetical protein